ncbi:Omega-amidase NIT2-B [Gracilariopsis chorda]|uniref:Omega-amidase NIT2-B n=1 Tax=Gracilariopsis chorda TaxID=448386 RepID=A0A2V3IVG5_9FLOR|nr:Omega-amidase NIT2-B [Gracilariopsis chorda]|eukprot:PXF45130.1 Omega-amidase NIT2-B [Gracilariopsis chorda]
MSAESQAFKLALCQMLVTDDKTANLEKAADFLRRAKQADAKIAVLPECFQCPYDTACFRAYSETLPDPPYPVSKQHESPSLKVLQDLAQETGMYIVGGSVPEISEGKVYNTSMTVSPTGGLIAKHRKTHLFDIDVPGGIKFKESDALTAGDSATAFHIPELSLTAGVAICYDMRFPELAMVQARQLNASLLIYPGAFNLTTGPAHWELLIRARALDNQVFVAACSPARATSGDGYKAWGHSMVVDPWGKVVASTEEKESLVIADIHLSRVEQVRKAIPTSKQRRRDVYTLEYLK